MNEQTLSKSALFVELTREELATVVRGAKQYLVPENHTFFNMGDSNGSLFVVLSGSVRIERPGTEADTELAKLDSGAFFGEMSFMDNSKTTAKVSTVEPTEVLELNAGHFYRFLTYQPVIAYKLWRNLALELKRRLASTIDLVDYYADLSQVLRDSPRAAHLLGV